MYPASGPVKPLTLVFHIVFQMVNKIYCQQRTLLQIGKSAFQAPDQPNHVFDSHDSGDGDNYDGSIEWICYFRNQSSTSVGRRAILQGNCIAQTTVKGPTYFQIGMISI